MAPIDTVGPDRIEGQKSQAQRKAFLAYANGDGSERFPMLLIGKGRQPHCFQKRTGAELGFESFNTKAWMNTVVFFDWLHCFDVVIGNQPTRKVALLLDN